MYISSFIVLFCVTAVDLGTMTPLPHGGPVYSILYDYSWTNRSLAKIDPYTGQISRLVHPFAPSSNQGISFSTCIDPAKPSLYLALVVPSTTTFLALSSSGRVLRQRAVQGVFISLTWDSAKSSIIAVSSGLVQDGQASVLTVWTVDPTSFAITRVYDFEPIFIIAEGTAFDPKSRTFYIQIQYNWNFRVAGVNVDTGVLASMAPMSTEAPISSLDVDPTTSTIYAMWFNSSGSGYGYNLATMDKITGRLQTVGAPFLSRIEVPARTALNSQLRQYLCYSVQGGDGIRNEFHVLNLDTGEHLLGFATKWWSNLVTFAWSP